MTIKRISILIIDDDEVDVMNVRRSFRNNNISHLLNRAGNGLEALAMLRGEGTEKIPRPDIILLDINMPRMGGIEFLQELRADEDLRSISVIIMTTSNSDKDKINAYNLNVAGYIIKPVSADSFNNAVVKINEFWNINEFP